MNEFFGNQIDYILFFYGLAFVMLAVICVVLLKQKTSVLPWRWLGAFGGMHGLKEWIGVFTIGYTTNPSIETVRMIMSAGSFMFLFEFGLRGFSRDNKTARARYLYIPLLLLTALGGLKGIHGVDAASRYTFGLIGGLLATKAVYQASLQARLTGRKWLLFSSISLGLYAVIAGIVVHTAEFWPASVMNSNIFYLVTGWPVQVIKGVLAICIALSVWGYSQCRPGEDDEPREPDMRSQNVLLPAILFIGIIIAGWGLTEFAGKQAMLQELRDGNINISALANHFTDELSSTEQAATGIAHEQAVRAAMISGTAAGQERAASILRQYVRILDIEASVAFLLDLSGRTVLSSEREHGTRFFSMTTGIAGQYFKKAAEGMFSSFYMVDETTLDRFHIAYYPVRDTADKVIGVAVIKKNMADIEMAFKKHEYCFLVDPYGVIFLSSRDDLRGKSLWPLSPSEQQQLTVSGQFGPGPFTPLMQRMRGDGKFVNVDGKKLLTIQRSLGHNNWSLVLLNSTNHIKAYRLFSIFTTLVFFSMAVVLFAIIYFSRDSEARIATSERHYRSLVEGSPNCVVLFTAEGRCLSVNRSGILQTGLSEDEIVGRMIQEIWPDRTMPATDAFLAPVQKGMRYTYESERVRLDGRQVMWHAVLNPLYDSHGRISRIMGIFTDITQRKKAEAELKTYHERLADLVEERTRELTDANQRLRLEVRERLQAQDARRDSEERFHSFFNLASDGIFLLDPSPSDGPVIVDANLAASAMNGYSLPEIMGRPIAFLDHPDDVKKSSDISAELMNGGTLKFEIRHVRKDGTVFPVEASAKMVVLGGRPYILAIDRDISARKLAEEELRKHRGQLELLVEERTAELKTAVQLLTNEINFRKNAEETLKESETKFRRLSQEFHTLLDAMTDELLLISPDLRILWANKAFALRVGREVPALPGENCYTAWFKRDNACEDCGALMSFSTGRPQGFPPVTLNGRIYERRAFPIRDESGVVQSVIIVSSDTTEKTTLQSEAMRAGHLASLGELSAGVAHEINNPITGIINYAQLLANKNPEGSREHDIAKRIVREGERIAGIVRSLLSFARERREDKTLVLFEKILRDSITLTEAQIKKDGISLRVDLPLVLPKVLVNSQQIQQVILNILSNARYALNQKYPDAHEDKVIEVTGGEAVIDSVPYVRIIVRDHGSGISSENIGRVMDPFFSTKPVGEGTGLGLSISHGIIRDHGGRLRIESREGIFTDLIVELPSGGARGN
ncbi:MAG: PAS domain S-box protein [Thermodesulfovibrionales bacterium]